MDTDRKRRFKTELYEQFARIGDALSSPRRLKMIDLLAQSEWSVDELEERLDELPEDREIIAYCRGPYCVFSEEAVEKLREVGFAARRRKEGLPDWSAEGHPIARTESNP